MSADAREASLRAFGKPSLTWWLVVSALSLVVLDGIYAWTVQLRYGMGASGSTTTRSGRSTSPTWSRSSVSATAVRSSRRSCA